MSNLFSSMSTINLAAPDGSTSSSASSGSSSSSSGTSSLSWSYVDPCATTTTLFSNKPFPIPSVLPTGGANCCSASPPAPLLPPRAIDCITPEDNIVPLGSNNLGSSRNKRKSPIDDSEDGDTTSDGMTPTPSGKGGDYYYTSGSSAASLSSLIGAGGGNNSSGSSDSLGELLDCIDHAHSLLPLGFDIDGLVGGEEEEEEEVVMTPSTGNNSPNKSSSSCPSSSTSSSSSNNTPLDYHSHSLPKFASLNEAADYVNTPRNDIDMEVQNCLRTYEKAEALQTLVAKWQKQSQLADDQRHASIKILVHEAANRSIAAVKHRHHHSKITKKEEDDEEEESLETTTYEDPRLTTYAAWKSIEDRASTDCRMFGYQTPQRNLSCMCIFNPDLVDTTTVTTATRSSTPLPCPYGENDDDRNKRGQQQAETLRSLQLQQAEGKSSSLFLDAATSVGGKTTATATPRPSFMTEKQKALASSASAPTSRFASSFQQDGGCQ